MSNKKSKDLTKNKNIGKKEKTFCQVNENVRYDYFSKICNYYEKFKRRKSIKKEEAILKDSKPLFDLYYSDAFFQLSDGKIPESMEEYNKIYSKLNYATFYDGLEKDNEIKYWIFYDYIHELYYLTYDSNQKKINIHRKQILDRL